MKPFVAKLEYLGVFTLSLIPLLWGFTRYPKLVGDEGIYVSQAWWLVGFGKLGPYTYWYDHFPLGWLIIGLWQKLVGPFLLGNAELTARLGIILLVALGNVFLYSILKTITNRPVALLGLAFYAFSPLSLIFHRQVLLENIAVCFFLMSLWLLVKQAKQHSTWLLPGCALMGLAILTKESYLFLGPAYLIGCWLVMGRRKHWPILLLFCGLTLGSILAIFPLFAALKGELVAAHPDQISLVNTVFHQIQRGNYLPWWQAGSEFRQKLATWVYLDPLLMLVGLGSTLVNLIRFRRQQYGFIHLMTLSFLLFLIRGGLVLDYYLIPGLSLLVIEICLFWSYILAQLRRPLPVTLLITALVIGFNLKADIPAYTYDVTAPQLAAYDRLIAEAQPDDVIITDNYFFLNLRYHPDFSPRFANTHWYTKVESDPVIQKEFLQTYQGRLDWLLQDDTIKQEIALNQLPVIKQAVAHTEPIAAFPLAATPGIQTLYREVPYAAEPLTVFKYKNVSSRFATAPLSQKIGQLLWTTPVGYQLTPTEKSLLENQLISGVVLTKANVENTTQLPQLIHDIKTLGNPSTPPLVAISFEGGQDTPIPWLNGTNPGGLKSSLEAEEMAQIRANQLKNLGFTAILGPIVDRRLKGSTYDLSNRVPVTAEWSLLIAHTYQDMQLLPFLKYFPGGYSHTPSMASPVTLPTLWTQADLEPYQTFFSHTQLPAGLLLGSFNYPVADALPNALNTLIQTANFSGPVMLDITGQNLTPALIATGLNQGITLFYHQDSAAVNAFIATLSDTETVDQSKLLKAMEINYSTRQALTR